MRTRGGQKRGKKIEGERLEVGNREGGKVEGRRWRWRELKRMCVRENWQKTQKRMKKRFGYWREEDKIYVERWRVGREEIRC